VPAALLPQLQQLKDGQNGLVETPQAVYVVRVAGSQPAPVDEKAAQPAIRQHLAMQRNREAVTRTMAELKQKANIEYLNEYAASSPAAASQAASAAKDAAQATSAPRPSESPNIAPVASSGATEAAGVVQPNASNIENGVKGLR
jgi:di/tripeptidase